jgi:hypothetical protein
VHKTLLNMDDSTFAHHVNQERNDFFNWVNDIYGDKALSSTVLSCRTKNELAQKLKEKLNDAVKKKKAQDVRRIIEEAKKEVKEKIEEQEKSEAKAKIIESRPEPKKEHEQPKIEKKPEIKIRPRTEKHVFVNRPPRTFSKEEKPVNISSAAYMKASVIDFVFGIIIGVIAILILKQLL